QPNTTEWSFQSNFMKMPNLIQNSNDNSKFSTSLKDLGYDNYQAVLNIAEITQEDIQTKFKLHVANEMGEADYKVILFMANMSIDRFSGPYENIWSKQQCEFHVWYIGESLTRCKNLCLEWYTCTALNYKEGLDSECILWTCPLPAPSPKSTQSPYKGYALIP
ncbi:unnamed protein product, partial [Meganyctiphanes norvegica]